MRFVLTISEGAGAGRRFEFEQDRVRLGRGDGNEVVLADPGISRLHAAIERRGDGFVLLDEGSANGTELNGVPISAPEGLRAGDRFACGDTVFRFSLGAQGAWGETSISAGPSKALAPRRGWMARCSKLPRGLRFGTLGAVAMGAATCALLARSPSSRRARECPDAVAVDEKSAGSWFGHAGSGVDCGSSVVFGFTAPPDARVLFHYTPARIAASGEVELQLNGQHLGWAPASAGAGEPQVVVLPARLLDKGGRNFLSFSASGPGGEWSVGKVRVETLAVTPGDPGAAQTAYERGRRKLEERRVAPRNLYDAWKAFAEARSQLEGIAPRPPLYGEVAELIRDCERDLDRECGRLVFSAQRFERYGQDDKAQQTWREVLLHFPGEDPTGCRRKAQANLVSAQAAGQE